MVKRVPSRVLLAGALAGVVALGGCRGDVSENRPRQILPDLDDQEKYKPQTESRFFADYTSEEGERLGRSMREPVFGTVAFGAKAHGREFAGIDFADRDEYLRADGSVTTGKALSVGSSGQIELDVNGRPVFEFLDSIPIAVTRELLETGQKQFNINCLPCHGGTGAGDGLVGARWAYVLPNFHDEKYQPGGELGQDGYIFSVIRNGVPNPGGEWELKMPSYARKLTIEETWGVVAYFRALQLHRKASPEMLPEQMRLELERRRAGVGGGGDGVASSGADEKEASS